MTTQNVDLSKSFVLTVALLVSISPLATDTYLAAFSQMSTYYNTSINMIEITLSVYLLGYAIGQLIGGPLADKYGRKMFIFIGIVIFFISTIAIIFTSSIENFWIFRLTQAFGSGFITVNSLAMIRDLYSGKQAAKAMSLATTVMMLAPILAPVIGTTIINFTTWHYIFLFLAVYSLFGSIFAKRLAETSLKNKDSKAIENYKKIFKEKVPMLLIIVSSLSFSGLFIFITKSSYMYMEVFKFSANEFTIAYASNVMMLVVFGIVNMYLLKKYSLYHLLITGLSLQLVLTFALVTFTSILNVYSITFIMMLYIGSLGFIFANAFALILEKFKDLSGTASALNGVLNSLIAAILAFVVSILHNDTLMPMFIMLALVTLASFVIVYKYKKDIKALIK